MAAYVPERDGTQEWTRRGKSMHRVMKRIARVLGQFTPNEMFVFNPKKGFTGNRFFRELYEKLPRRLQRRFLLLDKEPAPTTSQYRKLEREILGHARDKLRRELVNRILKLPSKPRRKGSGRPIETEKEERLRIRKRVKEMTESGNEERMSKRQAIKTLSEIEGNPKERTIWRIVLGH